MEHKKGRAIYDPAFQLLQVYFIISSFFFWLHLRHQLDLYEDKDLFSRLKSLLENAEKLKKTRARTLTKRFSWTALKEKYVEWFTLG